jgi:hypothetical protein
MCYREGMLGNVRLYLIAALATTVCGCAAAPQYSVVAEGSLLNPPLSYTLMRRDAAQPQLSSSTEAVLTAALAQRGFKLVDASGNPDVILLVGLAERPGLVGVASAGGNDTASNSSSWISAPHPDSEQIASVALHFLDSKTGKEMRSVRAEARYAQQDAGVVLPELINEAAAGYTDTNKTH